MIDFTNMKVSNPLLWVLLVGVLFVHIANAICPNGCNGHGSCTVGNVCQCYDGWNGGAADCSFRECKTGPAWADKATATDIGHNLVECSNAGSCDRRSGLCNCFPGFAGTSCQRSK